MDQLYIKNPLYFHTLYLLFLNSDSPGGEMILVYKFVVSLQCDISHQNTLH